MHADRYHHNDVSFEAPQGWVDATIVRFHPPPSPPGTPPVPCITMWREPLAALDTLQLYAARLIVRLGRMNESFELLQNENIVIDERPAILIRCRSNANPEAGWMEETMALTTLGSERERLVAVFSFACPEDGAESNRAVFSDFLRSVRVEAAPAPASTGMRPIAQGVEMDVALPPMPGVRGR